MKNKFFINYDKLLELLENKINKLDKKFKK